MRKVIVQAEISLDGVQDHPDLWGSIFDYHNEAVDAYLKDQMFASDTLLMGRLTYEAFAGVWPTRTGEVADKINAMPKFVASRTLNEPLTWNALLLKGDAAEEVAKLKQQPGEIMLQYGMGELTYTLLKHGLVDEVRFLVYPFAVGNGQRIFDAVAKTTLKLLDTKTFSTGVVVLHYQVQHNE